MSDYIPHNKDDIAHLLDAIGKPNIDALFDSLPEGISFESMPEVYHTQDERELYRYFCERGGSNTSASDETGLLSFLGGGCYAHYVPSAVDSIASRSEYCTSYTPYQPEMSQGNLQVGFEFQSMVANLVGLDVANASMYDGANALLEGLFMARRLARREGVVLLSEAIHPEYLDVIRTYARDMFELEFAPIDPVTGQTDWSAVDHSRRYVATAVQHPNYFGVVEDLQALKDFSEKCEGRSVVVCNEMLSLGVLKPPGEFGIDIVAGEGQSLGNYPSYGGPHLGIIATTMANVRQLPGRLVGETVDANGQQGYVLTLSTREQHIRREKATSNICTNQFLLALRATIYMALMGSIGLHRVAFRNAQRMTQLLQGVGALPNIRQKFSGTCFNECVLECDMGTDRLLKRMEEEGILAGIPLAGSGLDNALLVSVSELHSENDIDAYVSALGKAMQ